MAKNKLFRIERDLLAGDDEQVLLCLPRYFQDVLLACTERLEWARTYGTKTLTDHEWDRIEDGIYALSQEECNMQITVSPTLTQTCASCGGGGGGCTTPPPWDGTPMPGGTPCYPIPIINPPINPTPPTPPPGTPESEWDAYRCKLANYAYDQIRAYLVAVGEVPGTLITIGAILTLLWTLAPLALLSIIGVAVLELATLIWSWYALSEGIDEIAEFAVAWFDERHQEIVCQFYDMTDPAITRAAVVSEFLEDLAVWAESRPWWIDSLAQSLQNLGGALFPLQIFLAPWELVPPTGYTGTIDCTLCGSTPVDPGLPEAPVNYMWVSAPLTAVTFVPNNGTAVGHTDGEGIFTHAPASPLNYHEVMVNVSVQEVLDYYAALDVLDLHGIAVRVQQYGASQQVGSDGLRLSSNTGGAMDLLAFTHLQTFWFHHQNDNTAVTTLAASFDNASTYGNGVMIDVKASFRSQTYGSVSPASMVYDVWYLASVT